MLKGINQKTKGLLKVIQNYGCLFLCFASVTPYLIFEGEAGILLLNYMWADAKEKGYINEEDDIVDHTGLAQDIFKLKVKYDGVHHDADETIPEEVSFAFGEYFWQSSHFVVIDNDKKVVFDPLIDSNTVKNGALRTMRWYYAI